VCYQRGLWLIPVNGAAPKRLTPPRNGHGVDPGGDIGAWALPSGLYLQAVGACSQIYIVKQLRDGNVQAVDIPGTYGNNNGIIGSLGTRLLVRARTGCPGSDSLLWFDPATRVVQMLLRAPHNVSGVLAAIPRVR
jgi:TolB protein